ncbi:hypothetical protein BH20CHL3_BH20CHL3_10400 [soil metagenome]
MSGDGEHSVLLLGAQHVLDRSMGYVHTRTVHTGLIEDARAAVTADVFDEMWAYGESLPLEGVVDTAMTTPIAGESISRR